MKRRFYFSSLAHRLIVSLLGLFIASSIPAASFGAAGVALHRQAQYEQILKIDVGAAVGQVTWNPSDQTFASSEYPLLDTTQIKIWGSDTGEVEQAFETSRGWNVTDLVWDSNGRFLAVGYTSRVIDIWDTTTDLSSPEFTLTHEDTLVHFSWSPDSTQIASTTSTLDGFDLYLWDVGTGTLIGNVREDSEVQSVHWSPDGEKLAVVGFEDHVGITQVWDATTFEPILSIRATEVGLLDWSPDGSQIAGFWCNQFNADCIFRVSDISTGELLVESTETIHIPLELAYSPDGNFVSSVGNNTSASYKTEPDSLDIWDAHTGEILFTEEFTDRVTSVDWSPDGTRLVASSEDWTIRVWSIPHAE